MGMSFGTAMAAKFQGDQLAAELDLTKAQAQNTLANAAVNQAQAQKAQREAEQQAQMTQYLQSTFQKDAADQAQPVDNAQQYQKAAQDFLQMGNMVGAKAMQDAAKQQVEFAKDTRVEQAAKRSEGYEVLARAALDYQQNPTPETQAALTKTAIIAGENPLNIPAANDPAKYASWANNLSMKNMTSKEQVQTLEKRREYDQTFQQRQEAQEDRADMRRQQMQMTAAFQSGSLAIRQQMADIARDRLEDRKNTAGAREEQAKNKADYMIVSKEQQQIQKEGKDFLADRKMVDGILTRLSQGGSAADDKQIMQDLVGLNSTLKGRSTNLYYKENGNFGNIAERLEGLVSRFGTGRLSDEQRHQIYDSAVKMRDTLIDPSLAQIEAQSRKRAAAYGVSKPDEIGFGIPDLNRNAKKPDPNAAEKAKGVPQAPAPAASAPVPGTPAATAPVAAPAAPIKVPANAAGVPTQVPTARNAAGQVIYYRDGKWGP